MPEKVEVSGAQAIDLYLAFFVPTELTVLTKNQTSAIKYKHQDILMYLHIYDTCYVHRSAKFQAPPSAVDCL